MKTNLIILAAISTITTMSALKAATKAEQQEALAKGQEFGDYLCTKFDAKAVAAGQSGRQLLHAARVATMKAATAEFKDAEAQEVFYEKARGIYSDFWRANHRAEEQPTAATAVPAPAAKAVSNSSASAAAQLVKAYKDNPIAADAEYRDKPITVTGTVTNIDREMMQHPYLIIDDAIQCVFPKESEANVANLKKGQRVTVTGEVKGKHFIRVLIEDCALEKAAAKTTAAATED
jgi:hypothetical protein